MTIREERPIAHNRHTCSSCQERALEAAEAAGERAAELAAERWFENGGDAALRIAAEDDLELEVEAMDEGLQELRRHRIDGNPPVRYDVEEGDR